MPKGEIQNHIAWCFKRFANFTDYIDHHQYFSRLNDAQYIQYNTVAIEVRSFECNERAVHMVPCTGSTRWRKHMPPRDESMHPWMGKSPDSHFMSAGGCLGTWLKVDVIVEDAELSVKSLLTSVQTFVAKPICQTAVMVILEERHQPQLATLHNGSYYPKPLCSVGTTCIGYISMIQGAVHRLPLMPQPDSTRWYLSNTMELNGCNLFYK